MFDRFTDRAKLAFNQSRALALEHGSGGIAPVHIFGGFSTMESRGTP